MMWLKKDKKSQKMESVIAWIILFKTFFGKNGE